MSPLPISRSALDRLGERLAEADRISEEDYSLLLEVVTAYQAALDEARRRLVLLGYEPTTRVKTTSVLIDKLRREQGMKLKGVQDIAGARIVADCDRAEQDAVVQRIVAEFANESRPPKVKDRREEPSAGYRAVHVIVSVLDVPVEIQVRTWFQDRWAQIVESLADKWGRGIRYGDEPEEPDREVRGGGTRGEVWAEILSLAESIDSHERLDLRSRAVKALVLQLGTPPDLDERLRELSQLDERDAASMRRALDTVATLLDDLD